MEHYKAIFAYKIELYYHIPNKSLIQRVNMLYILIPAISSIRTCMDGRASVDKRSHVPLLNIPLDEVKDHETKTFRRYHIEVKQAPPKVRMPTKFIVKQYNNCVNLQECIEACVYGVHRASEDGQIAEPSSDSCRRCHVCALTCPKGALSVGINPEFAKLGTAYFTPDRMETIYFEAETGRVPVSGTGYGGPFAGRGFDGMWFDFSEIVRPTRDGIHGREHISTSVDLGRKLSHLEFDESGKVLSDIPRSVEISLPVIFDPPLPSSTEGNLRLALARAAAELNTFTIVEARDFTNALDDHKSNLIPRIRADEIERFAELIATSRVVEIDAVDEDLGGHIAGIKEINPAALVSLRFPYDNESDKRAESSIKNGADIVHLYFDEVAIERDPDIVDVIQRTHSYLVDRNMRDEITLISGGGIAEAAHIPKSIILGADAVSVGLAYQIALGCKVCTGDKHVTDCPLKVEDEDVEWATQRIMNLMSSWRDQLLEVLGGMGLREVRRQRGESGRAMFYRDLEERIFGDRG
jgi:NAD-dependent dihydropyrimidine dehydrogenase PreA subunit